MIKAVLLFILGLLLLIKGGDWFVEGATAIAKKFHIPEILIGATVVSVGTTLPEVMVSASAAALGQGDMAYGNAIGSIICNVSLVAALTIAIKPGTVEKKTLKKPVIFFFIAAIIYSIAAYVMGFFYRWTGLLLLGVFVVYISVLVISAKKEMGNHTDEASEEETKEKPFIYNIGLLVIGAVLITIGARLLVNNGTFIASELGVPEKNRGA